MRTHLDLFAGIGGFALAAGALGYETIGFCEIDPWARRVLEKHWPGVPKHDDIRTLTGDLVRGWLRRADAIGVFQNADGGGWGEERVRQAEGLASFGASDPQPVDLLTGGYPCQPFSVAGQRLGTQDDRHLWPEMRRLIADLRPRHVVAENVAGHVTMGLDAVLADLETLGYACGALVVPACAVDALHRRDRVWILAHAERAERRAGDAEGRGAGGQHDQDGGWPQGAGDAPSRRGAEPMADAAHGGIRRGGAPGQPGQPAQRGQAAADADRAGWQEHGGRVAIPAQHATAEHARRDGAGPEVAWPLDPCAHGLSAGLVRRPAAGPTGWHLDVIRAAWADGSWEADLPRVTDHEPERRQKLQAAGNAIVPVLAYEILRALEVA